MLKHLGSLLFLSLLFFIPLSSVHAQSQEGIYITVDQAKVKKSLMALPPFQYQGSPTARSGYKRVGKTLYNTIFNDLDISSYFRFIKQEAFLENTKETSLKPYPGDPKGFKFENWRKISTEFLIRGGYRISGDKLTFEVFVYHVPQAKLVLGKTYEAPKKEARNVAHSFANDLIKRLTGKEGMFLSQIVVASDRAGGKWREIFVMDWDGHNATQITKHKNTAISPAFSPDGKMVAYTAYVYHKARKATNPSMFIYELYTGKRYLVSGRKGVNSGAAFAPDNQHLYLTLSQGGSPDIFRITKEGKNLKRITKGPFGAMNVEPAISPDGRKIAFSSDRSGGKPMLYIMNADGSNIKRVTFAGRYNSSPAWSPDGKKIAFAGWDKGHYDIFVMNPDGTGLKRLTSAVKANGKYANNEEPTFSPDGRHVMFTSDRTGKKQLYIVNVDGTNERRITVDRHNYYKPKWGWHKTVQ